MEPTGRDLLDCLMFEILNDLWHIKIFINSMAALTLIIALAATTPRVHRTKLIKCNRVEVTSAYLSDINVLKTLNEAGLTLFFASSLSIGCLFVQ